MAAPVNGPIEAIDDQHRRNPTCHTKTRRHKQGETRCSEFAKSLLGVAWRAPVKPRTLCGESAERSWRGMRVPIPSWSVFPLVSVFMTRRRSRAAHVRLARRSRATRAMLGRRSRAARAPRGAACSLLARRSPAARASHMRRNEPQRRRNKCASRCTHMTQWGINARESQLRAQRIRTRWNPGFTLLTFQVFQARADARPGALLGVKRVHELRVGQALRVCGGRTQEGTSRRAPP